jgi:hypothetical protein
VANVLRDVDKADPDDWDLYQTTYQKTGFVRWFLGLEQRPHEVLTYSTVTITNPHGVNTDHRGSDHCAIALPFQDQIVLESPTVKEFVDALYLLKSHKWDKWYELYSGCQIKKKGRSFKIDLDFDHGS